MKLKRVPGIECFMAHQLNPRQEKLHETTQMSLYGLTRMYAPDGAASPHPNFQMPTCSAIASAVYVLDVQPMLFGERAFLGKARHRLPLPAPDLRLGRYGRRAAPLARRVWFARTFCR